MTDFASYWRQWAREREERARRAGTWPRPAPEDRRAGGPETPVANQAALAHRAARLASEMKGKQ